VSEIVTVHQLVHGGQGMAILPDGKNVFMWNALPLEEVEIEVIKNKKSYAEAVVTKVIKASSERVVPKDEAYLSTSPWQILTYEAENKHKQEILFETFTRAGVNNKHEPTMYTDPLQWQYRNKMEYSFWADEAGLHLALFNRGTHNKMIVQGSSIARPEVDATAQNIVKLLNKNNIRGSQLKTVVVRCDQQGNTVAALFVKDEHFPNLDFKDIAKGVAVNFSNPKSPASVLTRQLYACGDITLTDTIMGHALTYDANSFFQVHLPIFEQAAKRIEYLVGGRSPVIDMYAGVGTLGILANASKLVELDEHNIAMAKRNIGQKNIEVIHASAETALEHILSEGGLIVDPPRAGLHRKVVDQILEVKPQIIMYLSCNPSTQARDLVLLQEAYNIFGVEGYNFFPRTPHIESLVTLERKS
jgi:23S rRNA (uracil1939-C5)-methyltransferase